MKRASSIAALLFILIIVAVIIALNTSYPAVKIPELLEVTDSEKTEVATSTNEHVCLEVEKFSGTSHRAVKKWNNVNTSLSFDYPTDWSISPIDLGLTIIEKNDQLANEYNNRSGETYFMSYSMGVYIDGSNSNYLFRQSLDEWVNKHATWLTGKKLGSYCTYKSPVNSNTIYVFKRHADNDTRWLNEYESYQKTSDGKIIHIWKPGFYSGSLSQEDIETFFIVTNSISN